MRYRANLQRFDSHHNTVAEGNDLDAVIYAATEVYTSLVPTILNRGHDAIERRARAERDSYGEYGGGDSTWRDTQKNLENDGLSACLSAEEWNVTVYDREDKDNHGYPPVVFTIGPTLETLP